MASTFNKVKDKVTQAAFAGAKPNNIGEGNMMSGITDGAKSLWTGAQKRVGSMTRAVGSGYSRGMAADKGRMASAMQGASAGGRRAKAWGGAAHKGLKGTGAYQGMAMGAAYGAGSDDTSMIGGAMMGGMGGYAGLKGSKALRGGYDSGSGVGGSFRAAGAAGKTAFENYRS